MTTKVGSQLTESKPRISFIFDDAHLSALDVLKPLFDTRGYKFGVALPGANLTSPTKINYNRMLTLMKAGYEIINHAFTGDAPNNSAYGLMKFRGEIRTPHSRMNRVGVRAKGFVTPNSVLSNKYKEELPSIFSYAFTVGAKTTPILKGTPPFELHRFNMEAEDEATNIAAVDLVKSTGGTIVYYAHDVVENDAQWDKIVAIMDRAEELGVSIVGPEESIKNVTELAVPALKYDRGDLITSDPEIYTSAGATINVTNGTDLNITSTANGLVRVEATIDLISVDPSTILTFSSTLRSISGDLGDLSAIGIELKDDLDAIQVSDEISEVDLNTNVARYNVSAVTLTDTVKATVYCLVDVTTLGAVALMRNPLLRIGTDVEAETFTTSAAVGITSVTIPTQVLTANALQTVTLTNTPDNGRFSIASNKLTITRDWVGSIHGTLVGGTQASDGGYLTWSIGGLVGNGGAGGNAAISPVTDTEQPTGCTSVATAFKVGQTLTLKCWPRIQDFSVSANTSRITSI